MAIKHTHSCLVSLILVNYNGADIIQCCLDSIYQNSFDFSYEVIVVDNSSHDNSPNDIAQKFPQVKLLLQKQNLGFGTANNIGVKSACGEFIFLLNSDTLLTNNILPILIAKLEESPEIGIIAPQLLNKDGSFQFSVSEEISLWGEFQTLRQVRAYRNLVSRPKIAKIYSTGQIVDVVVGAAMLMKRSIFEEINGFDQNFFMYFEDSDLCKRVRDLDYIIYYEPKASLVHIGGYSTGQSVNKMALEYRHSQRYYYKKHRPKWEYLLLSLYLIFKYFALKTRLHITNFTKKI